jgi:F-type H+-transporting ATPase subunit delta
VKKETTVASRYARALFLVTEKRGETVQALEDVKGLLPILAPGTRIANFLSSPGVRPADKRAVLKKGLDGRLGRTAAVFMDLLLRKQRLPLFATIVTEFEALVEKAQGIQRATVTSAVELTEAERDRLHRELERVTNGRVRLEADVDPALLGGAMVRIGDRIIDRSVRSLLDTIREQLHEVSV